VGRPVTLITGASKGIGRFLAEYYLGLGHTVVGCSRSETDLQHDGYVHGIADVTDEATVRPVFTRIRREFGHLDNLINNAGTAAMNAFLLTPVSALSAMLATNAGGTFLFCREAAKIMGRRQYGRMVNFSTVAVPLVLEGEAAYAASKAAIEMLTRVLARELAPSGITVNCIGPTPVDTDLIRTVPRDKIEKVVARQAIKRKGTFEDVANVVDFFLRRESEFVTGQTIYLGGVQ
jgi:3-oxoacyl-[acyl-carrier protein] reductase